MRGSQPAPCDCPDCLGGAEHPDAQYHRELRLFLSRLNDEQRRLYAAVESHRLGRGGVSRVADVMGLCPATIARGRHELADLLQGKSIEKERKPIPGRPRIEQQYPAIKGALEGLLSDEMSGSPEGERKWVRSSVAKLAVRLREMGFPAGHNAVWALLKRMGFSMRTSVRKRRGATRDPAARDAQFRYIASQKE